jgi:hypothetical protein
MHACVHARRKFTLAYSQAAQTTPLTLSAIQSIYPDEAEERIDNNPKRKAKSKEDDESRFEKGSTSISNLET